MHGAGTEARERTGLRKNPALASVRHGLRSRVETRAALVQSIPSLETVYCARLASSGYLALRREMALLETLLERLLVDRVDSDANALCLAIAGVAQLAALKDRQQRLARQLTPISAEELTVLLRGVDQAIADFVDPELRESFIRTVHDALGRATGG